MTLLLIRPYLNIIMKLWEYSFIFPQFIYRSNEKTFKYKRSFWRCIICLIIPACCFTGIKLCMQFGEGVLLPILNQSYYLLLTIHLYVSLYITYQRYDDIASILEKIAGFQSCLESSNIDCRSKLYGIGIIWGLFQTANGIFFYILNAGLWQTNYISWPILLLTEILELIDAQLYIFYSTLKVIMMGFARNFNWYLSTVETSENIREFLELERAINETNVKLFEIFSPIMFWKYGCECYVIVIGFFMLLTNTYSDIMTSGISLIDTLLNMYWLALAILRILFLISVDALIINESKRTAELLQRIQQYMGKHKLPYKSIELSLLNSKLNKMKFSVYEFFEIDWTLIYSMVAGITTYSIYLVQFREMEIENFNRK